MKTNKGSKRIFNHSDIEKSDINSQKGVVGKKDKGSKRRLSIYDDFEDDSFDTDIDNDIDPYYED